MKRNHFSLSKVPARLLLIGLPVIIAYLVYIFISVMMSTDISADALIHIFGPQLEHIFMTLTILIIGSLLLDVSHKEIKKE